MADSPVSNDPWFAVIGRSLAVLCLQAAEPPITKMLAKAAYLELLGLPRAEAARLLGTTAKSISELERQARNTKGGRRAAAKKKQRRK